MIQNDDRKILIEYRLQQAEQTIIDIKYGKILRNAFKSRSDSDYAPFMDFEKRDVVDMQAEMKDFIHAVSGFLKNRL